MLIECATCEATVDAKESGSFQHFDPDRYDFPVEVHLLQCPRCGDPILAGKELYGVDGERESWSDPYKIYPPEKRDLSGLVPSAIRSAFEEGERCFKARSFTAAAIMCRKTLEGVCDKQGIKSRNLADGIKKLHAEGLIDNRLLEWSDALRLTGNAAAHGVGTSLNREDAQDVLDFTEAIVDYVFVLRNRFEDFKRRREG
jgi:Domain of unknown function (DUF4145)